MPILPGRRLGPYEILSAIGAGGMGEVYKARDTRLDRTVAIKVLPTHLADRSELRERFDREAKTIASLNHPHICVLHDIGHQDGIDFLVMEHLEGETLAQRLVKGALPIQQVLRYAIEISDALDKAHRKGVTHRDLKPGNIMLTKSGTKLLDFGLAKLKQDASPTNVSLSDLPTENDPLTAQGAILGTLQYMAPEQVEGETDKIDARTDIFSFGAVVYEMATGKKAFEGNSQASIIGAILKDDPPLISALQPMTPPALDRVVKKCLAKDSDKRWQSASDVCDEIRWIAETVSRASLSPNAPASKPLFALWTAMIGLAGIVLGAVVASLATWNLKPTPTRPVARTVINLPPGDNLARLDQPALALSPDGSLLAYVSIARAGGVAHIYLRAMDSLEAKPIPATEAAINPFFSPDGQWLGFFSGGKLKKVSVNGGVALTLGNASAPSGAAWGRNGTIIFSPLTTSVLEQISDAGGPAQAVTRLEKGEGIHQWPELLPGGKAVLFVSAAGVGNPRILVQSLSSGERRDLFLSGTAPHYATSGHLIYAQNGNLIATPFDSQRLQIVGVGVPVAQGIMQTGLRGGVQYTLSATGTLAYVPGGNLAAERLVWVSLTGTERAIPAPPHAYSTPRISPDGDRIAVGVSEQDIQVWLYDVSRETLSPFTFEGTTNDMPVWTPDGKRIAFQSNRQGSLNIFWQLADGSGGLEQLTSSENIHAPNSFSPDGQQLAYHEVSPTAQRDIWLVRTSDPSEGSGQVRKTQPLLQTPLDEAVARFSPDGHWLAYISNESGRYEVYVQAYPGPGGKYQISTDGGTEPVWNPKGRELFYRNGNKMMAVEITSQPTFKAGAPRMLFEGQFEPGPFQIANYDVSPDGQRFLMIKPDEQSSSSSPTQIVVVQNWFEELKQKVPTGKK
jgi:serine/threonine protein kinase/Tol biopolymer transport system component